MARTVRIQSKGQIYYVRNTTVQQAYLFIPGESFNRLARGALARAARLHGANIYAVCFLLNQFKMLTDCPRLNLPEFMKSFQSELARAVKDVYEREGRVFEHRYYKGDVLGEDGLLERFLEITNAPIAAGLVPKIKHWAGINSYQNLSADLPLGGVWLNHTELRRLERKTKNKRKKFTLPPNAGIEHHTVELTRLPIFKNLSDSDYLAKLEDLRAEHAKELRDVRRKKGLSYVGSKRLQKVNCRQRPRRFTRFERPLSFGPEKLRLAHSFQVRLINRQYAEAMRVYVENKVVPIFPLYTCRPGLIICEKPKEEAVPA